MKAYVIGISAADLDGAYFPDGSDRFTLEINLSRGAAWDTFFNAMRDRKGIEFEFATPQREADNQ